MRARGPVPHASLTATDRALLALRGGSCGCHEVGSAVWGESRTGRIASVNGGGDYAAQMLLGRMRKAGLVRTTHDPGSSRWELTPSGEERAARIRT
jgi:hypothetical protein